MITQQCIQGFLYGDKLSSSRPVTLIVDSQGQLSIEGSNENCGLFSALTISTRVGNSSRHLQLPDGRRFETRGNDVIDQLCLQFLDERQSALSSLAHKLESNMKFVISSLLLLIGITYITISHGIPLISKQITDWLPIEIDKRLAEYSLPQMDSMIFSASTLTPEKQQQLNHLFKRLLPDESQRKHAKEFRLLFRNGNKIGANAFALPDGTIVITDQLVDLSTNDEMIASILLHEIGHIEHRHSVQNLVRQAGLSALIIAFTGDVNTASSLVLLLPNLLMQAQYSQEFEWQSDTYALEQMMSKKINPNNFALIMAKMSQQKQTSNQTSTDNKVPDNNSETTLLSDYLSTHPASSKRIARFQEAAKAFDNKTSE